MRRCLLPFTFDEAVFSVVGGQVSTKRPSHKQEFIATAMRLGQSAVIDEQSMLASIVVLVFALVTICFETSARPVKHVATTCDVSRQAS